jgi:Protein of unknown function (DUF3352)
MRPNLLRLALVAVFSAIAVALTACGGSSSDEIYDLGPDPATMVPADTPFYMKALIRPEGDLNADLHSALDKLLITDDSGSMIQDLIDKALADSGEDLTYEEDIAPWLGPRAGIFFNGYDSKSEEAEGAAVIAITDADAAQAFLDKVEPDGKATDYNGVSLTVDPANDTAVGVDGDFLLAGSTQGVEDSIDSKDSGTFADVDGSTTGLDDVPDNSLFSLYADPTKVVDLIKSSGQVPADQLKQIDDQLAQLGDGPIDAWGTVTDSSFGFGASAPAADNAPDPTDLLTTFPADSWLAFAGSDIGGQIQNTIEQFKAGFEAGLEQAAPNVAANTDPIGMFQDATGLNLEEDLAWIGDVGGFVEGTSIFGLGAGVVITTDDEQAATNAVDKVRGAISKSRSIKVTPGQSGFSIQVQGAPIGAQVAVDDGKVVIAAGADTVDDVVSPSEKLADSDTFQAAEGDLGDGLTPSFFVNFAPILDLVDSTGQSDADIESARPYLNALDFLIGGSKVDGDRSVAGFTLGVQDQPEDSGDSTSSAVITP